MTTCWICSGATSARSSAARIAVPPSSVASTLDRPPPSLPIGVRAAERITVLGIVGSLSGVGGGSSILRRRRQRPATAAGNVRAPCKSRRRTDSPLDAGADTIVVGVFEGEDVAHDLPGGALEALLDSGEAQRAFKRLAVTHSRGSSRRC